MSYRSIVRFSTVIAGAVALAAGPAAASVSTSTGWRIVATIGSSNTERPGLFAAAGPDEAFSSWQCVSCSVFSRNKNFIRHWNGRSWRGSIALPAAINYPRFLIAIGASSGSNLWAFTTTRKAGVWNGRHWVIKSLPPWVLRPSRVGEPFGQTAVFGRGNVWVFCIGAITQPALAGHYVHGVWRKVQLPGEPVEVSAVSKDDIWMLGITKKSLATRKPVFTAMQWNGADWRTLTLPRATIPSGYGASYHIVGVGRSDVWLSRVIESSSRIASVSLLHWNGRWHKIGAPSFIDSIGPISQDGRGGLWMQVQHNSAKAQWFLYHYRGGHWTRDPIPAQAGAQATLATITWIPGTDSVWAAGTFFGGGIVKADVLKHGP